MKLLLSKTSLFIYLLTVVGLLILLLLFFRNTKKVQATADMVEHTQIVLSKSNDILLDVLNIETGIRVYLLSKNETFLEPYNISIITITKNLDEIKELTKDNPKQQIVVDSMIATAKLRASMLEKEIKMFKAFQLSETEKVLKIIEGKNLSDKIKYRIELLNTEEFRLLKERKLANDKSIDNYNLLFILIFGTILLLSFILFYILRNQKLRFNYAQELELQVSDRTFELNEMNAALANKNLENEDNKAKILSEYARSLIEASHDPLITISADGKIMDVNKAMEIVSEKSKNILIDTPFENYFTDEIKAKEVYEQVFEKGYVADYPLTLKDGKLIDVLFNGSVYKDENGQVLGAVIVARDVTEQNRISTELTEAKVFAELATGIAEVAKAKAEDAVKSKQQFLSNMSHEIRTPMNAIIGFTKVILKTELTIHQREYLSAIKMSGDALIVLINDILDLAKVDAGKMVFEKTPFKLALSINAMLHLFESKLDEKNIKLIKIYDDAIPEVIEGDPVRLHQIILNLLSNAVKFTAEGSVTVNIQMVSQTEDAVTISFAVSDTGIGIASNKLDAIFENFQQASSGTSRIFGGTGLGLAIVKQLVEGQKGTINVSSELEKGSTFTAILVFSKTNKKAIEDEAIFEADETYKNIKVLVVEDILLNQLLMKTLLDDFGFECEIVSNGKLAVEKLQTTPFDIVLMDLQMPEMNGFEATDVIRNTMNNSIPIIALTADVTTVDVEKCKQAGMNDYISKPIDEKLLYSKIISNVKKPNSVVEQNVEPDLDTIKLKCIDLAYLMTRTKSEPKLMTEIINAFLIQTPELISTIKQSVINKDWNLLHGAVHKMIPSFTIMGMHANFEEMAKNIQDFANAQLDHEGIGDLVTQLEKECLQACKELQDELLLINKQL
jgi:PAS domain S-box-containing protein